MKLSMSDQIRCYEKAVFVWYTQVTDMYTMHFYGDKKQYCMIN